MGKLHRQYFKERIIHTQALFEEIREEEDAPPSNYSSRPPSPPLSVDEGTAIECKERVVAF